ncbi:putative collagen-binding domain-containing protein [bacterium]
MSGEKVIAWWYDTRTGEAYKQGEYKNEGSVSLDPPGVKHNGND